MTELSHTGHQGVAEGQSPSLARVSGKALNALPSDLYIPPDALQVFLETFEGPLDLLLYLIRRQNLDILEIQVASVTAQYIKYIELMQALRLQLAGEYLTMAATLTQIKSQKLLPVRPTEEGEEADPRAQLLLQLQEYERFQKVAASLAEIPQSGRDIFEVLLTAPDAKAAISLPQVELSSLASAFRRALLQAEIHQHHKISHEKLSTQNRMSDVLKTLSTTSQEFVSFHALHNAHEGRLGVVVTFLAILELTKEALIEITQMKMHGLIYVRMAQHRSLA